MLILSVCLLGTPGVWLLDRIISDPQATARPCQVAAVLVANAGAVVPSAPARQTPGKLRAKPFPIKSQIWIACSNLALAAPNSPVNSANREENQDRAGMFPAEALKWLRSAPEGEQRIGIAEIAGPELAQTDPAAALQLAENSPLFPVHSADAGALRQSAGHTVTLGTAGDIAVTVGA